MKEAFLVLESHRVRIVSHLAEAIRSWEPSTRISPVYLAAEPTEPLSREFEGSHTLFLIGPVAPHLPLEAFRKNEIWLSLGSFNTLIHFESGEFTDQILAWAAERSLNFEVWHVENGVITGKQYSTQKPVDNSWREELARLSAQSVPPELEELIKEYCPLMASALARAGKVLPEAVPDLLALNQFVSAALPHKGVAGTVPTYEGLKMLTIVNAGLSRFTSQAFSGTSPVSETECHFWTHSLLGTAVANVALGHFCGFVFRILGQAAIPRRVAALANKVAPGDIRIDLIDHDNEFWYRDHLAGASVEGASTAALLNPVVYFSGRDGFKSTVYSLSAPLAVIGACNSIRWTLLTLTHEISHNVIRAVLGKIYPRPLDQEVDYARALVKQQPESLLEAIRRYIVLCIFAMHQVDENSSSLTLSREKVRHALDKWHHEVEEIMVHVFDFLYFYEGNHEKYVKEIWLSWSVIPNIGNRVPEYVLRTLSAVLSLHLRRGPETEVAARDQIRTTLAQLSRAGEGGQYIDQAIQHIDTNWEDIKRALIARRGLVQIVRTFLYSDSIAAKLRGDEQTSGGAPERQGYPFHYLEFSPGLIDNPLRFVDAYTSSAAPSVPNSLWMLYMLAFNVRIDHGEE